MKEMVMNYCTTGSFLTPSFGCLDFTPKRNKRKIVEHYYPRQSGKTIEACQLAVTKATQKPNTKVLIVCLNKNLGIHFGKQLEKEINHRNLKEWVRSSDYQYALGNGSTIVTISNGYVDVDNPNILIYDNFELIQKDRELMLCVRPLEVYAKEIYFFSTKEYENPRHILVQTYTNNQQNYPISSERYYSKEFIEKVLKIPMDEDKLENCEEHVVVENILTKEQSDKFNEKEIVERYE